MNNPLLPVAAGLAGGIVASRYLPDGAMWYAVVLTASFALVSRLVGRRLLAIVLLGVLTGIAVERVDSSLRGADISPVPGTEFNGSGVVSDQFDGAVSTRLIVQLDSPFKGNCYLTVPRGGTDLRVGDEITFRARVQPLSRLRDVDDDMEMDDFYYRHYITCRAVVTDGSITLQGERDGLVWRFARYREHLIDLILSDGPENHALYIALLLGDTSMLDNDTRPDFAHAGVAHLLALSGMHVAVLAMLLGLLFWPLAWLGARRGRWVAVAVVLLMYALLTGMSPSVVRAVIMYAAVILAKAAGRQTSSLNALCLAAIVILVFSPRQLFAPGFQLSFLAVAALVIIPPMLPEVNITNRVLRYLYYYIIYTLAATCGTMLLAAYYFHIVPVYFLFSNLVFAFVLPVFMVGCIISLIFAAVRCSIGALDRWISAIADMMQDFVASVSSLPGAAITGVYIPLWALFAGYIGIILILAGCCYRPRRFLLSGGAVCLLLLALSGWIDRQSGDTLFIARSPSSTDIVYTRNGQGHVVTSARPHELSDRLETLTSRYADFMGRRGISRLTVDNTGSTDGNHLLRFGRYNIAVINSNDMPLDTVTRYDYMIVCREFTGDIVTLANRLNADTVLLGTDINGRRRHRYGRELDSAGRPMRSLENSYGLVLTVK